MKSTDPAFEYLVDIIQTTTQARINRQDAWFIAERLVEAGAIREDFEKPTAEDFAKAFKVFGDPYGMNIKKVVVSQKPDNLFMQSVEDRAKEHVKPVLVEENQTKPYSKANRDASWARFRQAFSPGLQQAILNEGMSHPNHPDRHQKDIPWNIDANRPYEEWEIMLIDGRGPEWDVFRDSYPKSLQKAILAQGKGHPNHPDHDHTDCCK